MRSSRNCAEQLRLSSRRHLLKASGLGLMAAAAARAKDPEAPSVYRRRGA
jgi:hypothetical protein